MSRTIAVADLGGTHARFALAEIDAGKVVSLGDPVTLRTADFGSLQSAWHAFGQQIGSRLPDAIGISVASPIDGDMLKLTNNPWVIRPSALPDHLGVADYELVNDFGAVAHAVARLGAEFFEHVCGPDVPLPADGKVTIVGPGTGLGVALLLSRPTGYDVIETEGGHIDFAPLDAIEDQILLAIRKMHRRVSVERVVSGAGLVNIYQALAALEGKAVAQCDDKALWKVALDGDDPLAAAALDRFMLCFGAVAGDLALAHGSDAVVIAGGLGLRLKDCFERSGFAERFMDKGRFERKMEAIPVKLITHPQPGLYGAAAAFARNR